MTKTNQTYVIKYSVFNKSNVEIHTGTIKCKNRMSEFHAKVSLEQYLQKKYSDFNRMIIHSCKEEKFSFDDLFKQYKDMFGTDNPFKS